MLLIGHTLQLQQLESDIANKNLSHAYLFTGPAQIGKFTIARHLAKRLQCQTPTCATHLNPGIHELQPQKCPTCAQIDLHQHFDTIELQDDGHSIKIETIRSIISRVNLSNQGSYACILIKNIDRMTIPAGNCLLKSLEEPPQKTLFILTSSSPQGLLDTIVSRSRQITFSHSTEQELRTKLTEVFPEKSASELSCAIELSSNKAGKAIHLLQNPEELASLKSLQSLAHEVISPDSGLAGRFKIIESISEDRPKTLQFLDLLITAIHKKNMESPNPKLQAIQTSALNIPKLLSQNVNPRLLFENLLLAL